ncbi:hypothetical protein Zmor_004018 [Zophobas morio]|uniref:Transposase Helix-turn-helix domain-containing protein n=1 Tax=Zophobas morio TaxID=2755281 RepID=A0AA38HM83_9CUCU|nr:hypothetical protein Zmor_004018 [Zophobas morio]
MLCGYYLLLHKEKRRRWWVRPINERRKEQGDYENLVQEMRLNDVEMFFNYTRLTVEQFDCLLKLVGPSLQKTSFREPITPGVRLTLTLRHLAAGDSIPTLAFSYRMGKSTVCNIINETNTVIWEILHPVVLKEPNKDEWERIAEEYFF